MVSRSGHALSAAGANGWNPRYQMLDAWRGVACLLVVLHHAGYAIDWCDVSGADQGPVGTAGEWGRWLVVLVLRRMKLGVALFFVISGYCIAASLDATARRGESPWAFLGRRVWRIYPPYWVALFGFALFVAALDVMGLARLHNGPVAIDLDSPWALDWRQWAGNLTLTETWRPHVFGPSRNVYTAVAWSLCFEEQFYLVCFLALLLSPGRVGATVAGASLAILVVRVYAWHAGALSQISGTFPLLWHEFAIGLAVYYRLNQAQGSWSKRLVEAGLLALLVAGLMTRGRSSATAAGFGLVLIILRRWDAPVAALRWPGPLRACGRRCYSIYLAHLPIGVVGNHVLHELGLTNFWGRAFLTVPLVSTAGVAMGLAFYALVEARFLSGPPTFSVRRLTARYSGRRRDLPALADG